MAIQSGQAAWPQRCEVGPQASYQEALPTSPRYEVPPQAFRTRVSTPRATVKTERQVRSQLQDDRRETTRKQNEMSTFNLQGSNTKPRHTEHCISHNGMRAIAGGCYLGSNLWVCGECWQRRRLTAGAAVRAANAKPQKGPDKPSTHPSALPATVKAVMKRTREHWGLGNTPS